MQKIIDLITIHPPPSRLLSVQLPLPLRFIANLPSDSDRVLVLSPRVGVEGEDTLFKLDGVVGGVSSSGRRVVTKESDEGAVVGGAEGGDAKEEFFIVKEEDGEKEGRERHRWVGNGSWIADAGRGVGRIIAGVGFNRTKEDFEDLGARVGANVEPLL
jgi:hypothetical protein